VFHASSDSALNLRLFPENASSTAGTRRGKEFVFRAVRR
jgi:hypothetical protein